MVITPVQAEREAKRVQREVEAEREKVTLTLTPTPNPIPNPNPNPNSNPHPNPNPNPNPHPGHGHLRRALSALRRPRRPLVPLLRARAGNPNPNRHRSPLTFHPHPHPLTLTTCKVRPADRVSLTGGDNQRVASGAISPAEEEESAPQMRTSRSQASDYYRLPTTDY